MTSRQANWHASVTLSSRHPERPGARRITSKMPAGVRRSDAGRHVAGPLERDTNADQPWVNLGIRRQSSNGRDRTEQGACTRPSAAQNGNHTTMTTRLLLITLLAFTTGA